MSISESDPKFLWLAGTCVVSTIGFLITAIKGAIEIKRFKMEIAALKRNASAAESRIYIPRSTEERIRYGSKKIFQTMVIAISCAVIFVASASIAIPIVRAQLQHSSDEKNRLELTVVEQGKEITSLRKRLKVVEDAYLQAVNGTQTPIVPLSPFPKTAAPSPTPSQPLDSESRFFGEFMLLELSLSFEYGKIEELNSILLRTVRTGDYEGFRQLIHPRVRDEFSPARFASLRAKSLAVNFSDSSSPRLLRRVELEIDHRLYVVRLKAIKDDPAVVIETLGVVDDRVSFLTLEVYEFSHRRDAR